MSSVAGLKGQLLVGGRVAARLANWSLERRAEGAIIHAQITERDIYWLDHASRFDLRLDIGKRGWRWRGVDVVVIEDSIRIEVRERPGG